MTVDLSLNPSETANKIIKFIKNTVNNACFSKVVLGLSGGVDSATSFYIAVKALGKVNIHVGIFPYGDLNKSATNDAILLTNKLDLPKPNIHTIDISSYVDPIVSSDSGMDNLRRGNIIVRIRMILLYDLSKKYKALVVGTENKSEKMLGYYTRFGDEASDIEPITGLYKTQVKQLARYLQIPEKIINKSPTAGMWNGQTDEGEFGFTYEDADRVLNLHEIGKNKEEIIQTGIDRKVVDLVIKRLKDNAFKKKVPYCCKLSQSSLYYK